jgi:hypothetical protein
MRMYSEKTAVLLAPRDPPPDFVRRSRLNHDLPFVALSGEAAHQVQARPLDRDDLVDQPVGGRQAVRLGEPFQASTPGWAVPGSAAT